MQIIEVGAVKMAQSYKTQILSLYYLFVYYNECKTLVSKINIFIKRSRLIHMPSLAQLQNLNLLLLLLLLLLFIIIDIIIVIIIIIIITTTLTATKMVQCYGDTHPCM